MISLINSINLEIVKPWETDSDIKPNCGSIFMIDQVLHYLDNTLNSPAKVIYSYDLKLEKSEVIKINFENNGGNDTS